MLLFTDQDEQEEELLLLATEDEKELLDLELEDLKLLDDECELSELKLLPLEQGLLDEIDELLILERQLEEEQAELLGNPLLLQLDEQQEVKLSDQQLHEELDEKENLDELLLDDDDRLLELLQVEELQLILEYDPQDPDNEDEELDPLP